MSEDAIAPPAPRTPADAPGSLREALPIFLGHASPRLLLALFAAFAAARLVVGGFSWWDLVPVAALAAFWPLQEWLLHVFVLHFRPRVVAGRTLDFAVPRKHREHHRDPWNYEILFIPFHSFLFSVPLLVGIWLLVTPTLGLALTGLTAHLALALHYEAVHFLVHTRVVPRVQLYRRLWHNHRLHHFRNENYWYGVTMLSGDRLLGTAPDPDQIPTSPTVRSLHAL